MGKKRESFPSSACSHTAMRFSVQICFHIHLQLSQDVSNTIHLKGVSDWITLQVLLVIMVPYTNHYKHLMDSFLEAI